MVVVDELNGMPGILSARWAGRHGDDEANLQLLLDQLADTPDERLMAHFTCVIALVRPDGSERVVQGEMRGHLVREPRGANGFGYDPIFVPDGFSQTSAELTAEEKDSISHRGKALRALVPLLVNEPDDELSTRSEMISMSPDGHSSDWRSRWRWKPRNGAANASSSKPKQ